MVPLIMQRLQWYCDLLSSVVRFTFYMLVFNITTPTHVRLRMCFIHFSYAMYVINHVLTFAHLCEKLTLCEMLLHVRDIIIVVSHVISSREYKLVP